jgi:hypothetical protein
VNCPGTFSAELDGQDRLFDVAANYYRGPTPVAEYLSQEDDEKFWTARNQLDRFIFDYEAAAFFDDDIEASTATINNLFLAGIEHGLKLWQGALTRDSICGGHYHLLVPRESQAIRQVPYIELMCPFFSRAALKTCWPTFQENHSAWGLHLLWPKLLGSAHVVDALPVRHVRPLRGQRRMQSGKFPRQEEMELKLKYGLL